MAVAKALREMTEDITEWDRRTFARLTTVELTPRERERIIAPERVYGQRKAVLAVHWHPEIVPIPLAKQRIEALYPQAVESLIIPTQHNEILAYGDYAGVEVDCRADAFNRKVQLLLHFSRAKIEKARVLKSMMEHTYRYRQSQFSEFLETLIDPRYEGRLQEAARQTGTEADLVAAARTVAAKLNALIGACTEPLSQTVLKNKLLVRYANAHRDCFDAHAVDRLVIFVTSVKEIVKSHFHLSYFYEVNEVIDEARALGGCVVVPHPEQFWPVLLADYDVDGYEVWNPQSREFTDFLIQVVIKKNRDASSMGRRILVMMGDDTHLSEKLLDPDKQNPEKAGREIGHQPPWEDVAVRKLLGMGNFDKETVIREYRSRLGA